MREEAMSSFFENYQDILRENANDDGRHHTIGSSVLVIVLLGVVLLVVSL
jgi:hypothetical protein